MGACVPGDPSAIKPGFVRPVCGILCLPSPMDPTLTVLFVHLRLDLPKPVHEGFVLSGRLNQ